MELSVEDYWENRLKEHWGLEGVGYLGYGVYYNRWMYRVRRRVFLSEIRALDVDLRGLNVLDVGSGTGFYLDLWRSLGVGSIVGSDISDFSVERLRGKYPEISIVRFDVTKPLEAEEFNTRFDVITAFDVLFHIVDDEKYRRAFASISRLLTPGGYFIFSENFLHSRVLRSAYQVSRSIEEISDILSGLGFQVIRRVPMFVLMNAPVDTGSSWPLRVWRVAMTPVRMLNVLGVFFGAVLFPLEVFLIRALMESPTTEMAICRKAG